MVKTKTKSFELINGELKLFISYFDISTQSLQYTYTIFNCFFANKKIFFYFTDASKKFQIINVNVQHILSKITT